MLGWNPCASSGVQLVRAPDGYLRSLRIEETVLTRKTLYLISILQKKVLAVLRRDISCRVGDNCR